MPPSTKILTPSARRAIRRAKRRGLNIPAVKFHGSRGYLYSYDLWETSEGFFASRSLAIKNAISQL